MPRYRNEHGQLDLGAIQVDSSGYTSGGTHHTVAVTLFEQIGKGQFGFVHRAILHPEKTELAVKVRAALFARGAHSRRIPDDRSCSRQRVPYTSNETGNKYVREELLILASAQSDFIVQFHGAFFHDNEVCYCIEFMDHGSLANLYHEPVPELVLRVIAYSVVWALQYLEQRRLMHRDVKPTNILVNSRGRVKLCDFGVSGRLGSNGQAASYVGSHVYFSPERITGQGQAYSTKADVWSLGITLLEVALQGARAGPLIRRGRRLTPHRAQRTRLHTRRTNWRC